MSASGHGEDAGRSHASQDEDALRKDPADLVDVKSLGLIRECAVRETVTVRELILSESVEVVGRGSLVGLAAAVTQSDSTNGEIACGGQHIHI